MNPWLPIVAQAAFWVGAGWVLARLLRRDVNGLGKKANDAERKRIQQLAVQIEIQAEHPESVRRLAQWLYDSV